MCLTNANFRCILFLVLYEGEGTLKVLQCLLEEIRKSKFTFKPTKTELIYSSVQETFVDELGVTAKWAE